jgi:hypothetical protein
MRARCCSAGQSEWVLPRRLTRAQPGPAAAHAPTPRPPQRRSRTPVLIAAASAYILRHFDGVVESASWLQLPRALVGALLRSSELVTLGELRVLQAAIRWGLANLPPGGGAPDAAAAAASGASPASSARLSMITAGAVAAVAEAVEAYGAALRASGAASALCDAAVTPAEALLPPTPPTATPLLRSLLAPAFPALRLAQLPLHVLRSAVVGALVPAELTLGAVFHKLALEQEQSAAAAAGAGAPPLMALSGWAPAALGGGARREGAAGTGAGGAQRQPLPLSARLADALHNLEELVERRGRDAHWSRTLPPPSVAARGAGESAARAYVAGESAARAYVADGGEGAGAAPVQAPAPAPAQKAHAPLGSGLLGPSLHSPFPSFFSGGAVGVGGDLFGGVGGATAGDVSASLRAPAPARRDAPADLLHPEALGVDVLSVVVGAGGGGALGEAPFSRRFGDLRADGAVAHALLCKGVVAPGPGGLPAMPTPAALPPLQLRFDVHASHAPSVLLSNGGRTAAVVSGDPFFWHSSGVAEAEGAAAVSAAAFPAAASYAGGGGPYSSSSSPRRQGPHSFVKPPRAGVGAAGAAPQPPPPAEDILLPVLPLLSLPSPEAAAATAVAAAAGFAPPGNAPRRGAPPPPLLADGALAHLPIGRLTLSVVVDDSHSLEGFDPESEKVADAAAAWEGEAAFLYAAAASGSLSAPSLLHLPPLDLALCVLSAPTDIDGASAGGGGEPQVLWMHTNSGHVLARQPAGGPGVGPLRHLCSGLPWGVGSALTLTVDSATGDVGVAVANDGGGAGVGAGVPEGAVRAPAAPPPPPFALLPPALLAQLAPTEFLPPSALPWQAAGAAAPPPVRVLHAANPAAGPRGRVHAALARLPLAAVAEGARGLQVALLCRGSGGVITTLIPGPSVVA